MNKETVEEIGYREQHIKCCGNCYWVVSSLLESVCCNEKFDGLELKIQVSFSGICNHWKKKDK